MNHLVALGIYYQYRHGKPILAFAPTRLAPRGIMMQSEPNCTDGADDMTDKPERVSPGEYQYRGYKIQRESWRGWSISHNGVWTGVTADYLHDAKTWIDQQRRIKERVTAMGNQSMPGRSARTH